MKKTSLFLIGCLLFTSLSLAQASSFPKFNDVPTEHPNFEAIQFLSTLKIIDTTPNDFYPNEPITQADFILFALKTAGFTPQNLDVPSLCQDVQKPLYIPYFNQAIEMRAFKINIKKNLCNPDKKISKITALKFIFFINGIPTPKLIDSEYSFRDIASDAWFTPYIEKSIQLNLLPLDNTEFFRPHRKITRGQTAELLYRIYNYLNQGIVIVEPEVDLSPLAEQVVEIPKMDIFLDVWDRLEKDYYFSENDEITDDTLIYHAIKGLLNNTSDPYTVFQEPQESASFQQSLSGEFEGIGAHLLEKDGKIMIISLIKDSPAENAGLKAKDIITKVNDQDIEGLPAESVAALIRGRQGTQVQLTIRRPNESSTRLINITRDQIQITYVQGEILNQNIGYIELNLFGENTYQEFIDLINDLGEQNPRGFILDLRNNPGGFLNVTLQILNHFVPNNEPLTGIKYPKSKAKMEKSLGQGELSAYPWVILVNEGSASAAEILTVVLQEHNIAEVVGTTTFGKGTVQELNYYQDGSMLKITIAEWVTPSEKSIEGIGVIPDYEVKISSQDIRNNYDPQLEKAIQLIN